MKRVILIISLSFFTAMAAIAKPDRGSLNVSDMQLDKQGDRIEVSFNIAAAKNAVRKGAHLVITPVIAKHDQRATLPPIVVRGKSSRPLQLSDGDLTNTLDRNTVYLTRGEEAVYHATLPFEDWMQGADLVFEATDITCGSVGELTARLIAENIINPGSGRYKFVTTESFYHDPGIQIEPSTGDRLAELYSFIAPLKDFAPSITPDENATAVASKQTQGIKGTPDEYANTEIGRAEAEQYISNNQEGALMIYFRRGEYEADPGFGDNAASLESLYNTVHEIYNAEDCSISHIIIAGFASPEGTVRFNDELAWNRAVEVKELLVGNTPIEKEMISVYNGSVNWHKLRELVSESNMKEKERILAIIDSKPDEKIQLSDSRIERLKDMDGGAPYRQMLDNLFPKLRNAAFIKVYYENKNR